MSKYTSKIVSTYLVGRSVE